MRRLALVVFACLAVAAAPVDAAPAKQKQTAASSSSAKSTAKKKKKKSRRQSGFSGANAPKSSYRTEPLERPSGNIWLHAENLAQEVRVNIYKPDGSFDEASMAQLDELFRCLTTGEVRAMRAELYEQLSRVQDHFEGKQIQMVSGFRLSDKSSSRHFHASAADFRIKGVSIYQIKKFAETLDTGNMGLGIYPNTQFIHLDVRAPGEPSFRWTDYSGNSRRGKGSKKKPTGRTQPARKPVS
jgi:uncharacterized protein YcbK (DUF882 family)